MKRLSIFAAVLALLCVGVLTLLPLAVSSEGIRARVAERMTELTGRNVSFGSGPNLSVFPYLRFEFADVRVNNPAGFGDRPFMTVERLQGTIRLFPFLIGRIEPTEFVLVRPAMALAVDGSGRNNWPAALPSPPPPGGDRPGAAVAGGDGGRALGRIVVQDGTVSYANAVTGERMAATAIDASIDWPEAERPLVIDGALTWRGEKLSVNAALQEPLRLFAGGRSPVRFAATGAPLKLTFNGRADKAAGLQLEGDLSFTAPALRRMIAWLGTPMEPDAASFGAGSIKGKANWLGDTIAFSEAKFELDGNEAVGALNLTVGKARLGVAGTLAFDRLDVTPYIEAGSAAAGGGSRSPLNLPLLKAAEVDLRISAGHILMGKSRIGPVAASLVLGDGRLDLDIADAKLHGGTLRTAIDIRIGEGAIAGTVQAQASDVQLRPMLAEALGLSGIDGKFRGSIELTAAGRDWSELVASVAGTARFDLGEASLTGLDIAGTGIALREGPVPLLPFGRTVARFRSVGGDLAIGGGEVRTGNLTARSESHTVALKGGVSLLSPDINLRGTLAAAQADAASPAPPRIDFQVKGTWQHPMILPDPAPKSGQAGESGRNRPG